jgi:hypothetical protein
VREFTCHVLKDGKGWGRAADLIERCATAELPPTVVGFLDRVYALFPRPKTAPIAPADQSDVAAPEEGTIDIDAAGAPPAEGA